MFAPRDSRVMAISSALREVVPLVRVDAKSWLRPLFSGRFRREAGAGGGLEMDERDAVVRQEREVEAVGKGVGGDALHGGGGFLFRDDGLEILRIE